MPLPFRFALPEFRSGRSWKLSAQLLRLAARFSTVSPHSRQLSTTGYKLSATSSPPNNLPSRHKPAIDGVHANAYSLVQDSSGKILPQPPRPYRPMPDALP